MQAYLHALAVALALGAALPAAAQCNDPAARNGWVLLKYEPPTHDVGGQPLSDLLGYRFYAGQRPGAWTDARVASPPPANNEFCFDGLTSTGSWYFTAAAIMDGGAESAPSNIACFTMSGTACLPGPFETDVISIRFSDGGTTPPPPNAAATLTLTWGVFAEWTLAIANTGAVPVESVRLELTDQVFDWLRGVSRTITFTPANLTANNDDVAAPAATITTVVQPGETLRLRGDIDTRAPAGINVTVTFSNLPPIVRPLTVTPTGLTGSF